MPNSLTPRLWKKIHYQLLNERHNLISECTLITVSITHHYVESQVKVSQYFELAAQSSLTVNRLLVVIDLEV